jgi:hypothetical protein
MLRLLRPLTTLLGFVLLMANAASALALASAENRTSGSAAVAEHLVGQNTRLSEEAVRENLTPRYDLASDSPVAARGLSLEGKLLSQANPVGSALKEDIIHRAASFTRQEAAEAGTHFQIVGGDGVTRNLTQLSGDLNGVAGRFEYIVDSGGNLTHQRFVPGGSINGIPNVP